MEIRSCLYRVEPPVPKYLAPNPPVIILESYEIIPPSNKTPANNNGVNCVSGVFESVAYS